MTIKLVELINGALERMPSDEPRLYVGASSIGKACIRQIWYGYNGAPQLPTAARIKRILHDGKLLENNIISDLKTAGVFVICRGQFYQDSEVRQLQGHVDGVIVLPDSKKAILEIKTAKASEFQKFIKQGLQQWSPSYFTQIQTYMGMSKIPLGVELVYNKDTSELHEEWIHFDSIYYEHIKTKAQLIVNATTEPPRIANSAFDYRCKMCNYRTLCHNNASIL